MPLARKPAILMRSLSLNTDYLGTALHYLPEGSELKMIEGGSHIMIYEKNCYREFQDSIAAFLRK